MKPIARALADAARKLSKTSDTSRLDAELLMAEALHIDRDKLILAPPDRAVPRRFWSLVERRSSGEPIAYITGRRAFWNIDLHVG
ncbi:MAG TPA: peptide chain release factor N(5)-glutamine methyltransferase, partial [Sphingomicrobium sp.]